MADASSRFTSQSSRVDNDLQTETVGLQELADFRKKRKQILDQHDGLSSGATSRSTTPQIDIKPKKKAKVASKGKLSFAADDENGDDESLAPSLSKKPKNGAKSTIDIASEGDQQGQTVSKIKPNMTSNGPRILTKATLAREAERKEALRQEFMVMRQAVRETEMLIPFVFHDGTNIPGGTCKVKKGDPIWIFLDRSRKLGAEMGVSNGVQSIRSNKQRDWARVGVDDLMLVKDEIIIPHHYDFYYFLQNETKNFKGTTLFQYSATPTAATPKPKSESEEIDPNYDPLARPSGESKDAEEVELEGADFDPSSTKVVDRRWYEKNKHIYPTSLWEVFEPDKDYSKSAKRDANGNAFFYS